MQAKSLKADADAQEPGVCPMRNANKTHASGPRYAKCGRRCLRWCLQLKGIGALYEAFDGL